MKKKIKKYLDGVKCDAIKHANLATAVRAFIGAVYNCCGPVSASKIMEKFKLTNDLWYAVDEIRAKEKDTSKFLVL